MSASKEAELADMRVRVFGSNMQTIASMSYESGAKGELDNPAARLLVQEVLTSMSDYAKDTLAELIKASHKLGILAQRGEV